MNLLQKNVTSLSADERREIAALWQQAFGDPEDFIDFMLCGPLSDAQFFAAREKNTLCSMFFLSGIECKTSIGLLQGAYIYAVATEKEFRGKGIFPLLFSHATDFVKKSGAQFVLCKPSTPKLFDYYKKLGFENVCFSNTVQIKHKKNGYNFKETDFSCKFYDIYLRNLENITNALVKTRCQLEKSLICATDPGCRLFLFESGFLLSDTCRKHIKYICAPKEEVICAAESFMDFLGSDGTLTLYSESSKDGFLPYASALFFDGKERGIYCPLLFE